MCLLSLSLSYAKIKYVQLQQMCDDLFGDQLFLEHALSLPQHSLCDGTVLEATQLGAGSPKLTKLFCLEQLLLINQCTSMVTHKRK